LHGEWCWACYGHYGYDSTGRWVTINFLDVGGTANAQTVEAGFRIILADPNVEAILINIFGGIVRCDRVAQGIVDAYKNIGSIKVPIIVRLQGTNAELARELIDKSGLKVYSAIELKEAAELVNKVLQHKKKW
jgi:succinyl-CoA synthetase beta subunit